MKNYNPIVGVFGTVIVMVIVAGIFQALDQEILQAVGVITSLLFGWTTGFIPAKLKKILDTSDIIIAGLFILSGACAFATIYIILHPQIFI